MRIDLVCPYKEKDQAKQLGARWDQEKKVWYVVDVENIAPFMRWITRPSHTRPAGEKKKTKSVKKKERILAMSCNCNALPWDHCLHTR